MKILTIRLFLKKCVWTHGHQEFWETFYSRSPGAVPLITAWHEEGRMKRNHLCFAVGCNWLCLTGVKSQFLFILPLSCQPVINGTAPGGCESNFSQTSFCPRVHKQSLKTKNVKIFTSFCSFNISSNVMVCSRVVGSTWHALSYTKQNQLMWGFSMPKGFRIGQHIGQILGASKFTRTFGHTVFCYKLTQLVGEGYCQRLGQ